MEPSRIYSRDGSMGIREPDGVGIKRGHLFEKIVRIDRCCSIPSSPTRMLPQFGCYRAIPTPSVISCEALQLLHRRIKPTRLFNASAVRTR